jgi:DNA repair exonuclease SbcCD ATPase subunit
MIFPPFSIASGESGTSSALYVILAGIVCTGLGWWLRGWHVKQSRNSSPATTASAPLEADTHESEEELQRERGELAAKLATMDTALANAESARNDALRELETLRPRAASHDQAHERARQLEGEYQKALEDLITAESTLKAARLAGEEAHARAKAVEENAARATAPAGIDPEQMAALERQLSEARQQEAAASSEASGLRARLEEVQSRVLTEPDREALAAAREAASRALEESQAAVELNTRLHRELTEARTVAEEARATAASQEERAAELIRDLDEARSRIAALEISPPAERVAEPAVNISTDELAEARREAESVRAELKAANETIRKLKSELSAPKPRPILTSPRPEGGAPPALS